METIIDCKNLLEYLEKTTDQYSKYDPLLLRARDYINYKSWIFCIGFESPDGWFRINIRKIQSHFKLPNFVEQDSGINGLVKFSKLPPKEIMAKLFGNLIEEAKQKGISIRNHE